MVSTLFLKSPGIFRPALIAGEKRTFFQLHSLGPVRLSPDLAPIRLHGLVVLVEPLEERHEVLRLRFVVTVMVLAIKICLEDVSGPSRHARTPAAPEPRDLEAVAQRLTPRWWCGETSSAAAARASGGAPSRCAPVG